MSRNIFFTAGAALLLVSCGLQSGNPVSHDDGQSAFTGALSVSVGPEVQGILSMSDDDPARPAAVTEAIGDQNQQDLNSLVDETVARIESGRPEQVDVVQTRVTLVMNAARVVPGETPPGDFAAMLRTALNDRGIIYIVGTTSQAYEMEVPFGIDGQISTIRIEVLRSEFTYDELWK